MIFQNIFIILFSLELQKENKLARLLEEIGSQDKMLVFVETKRKADELTRLMRRDGYPAMCIHGDKQQREREWVLGNFLPLLLRALHHILHEFSILMFLIS